MTDIDRNRLVIRLSIDDWDWYLAWTILYPEKVNPEKRLIVMDPIVNKICYPDKTEQLDRWNQQSFPSMMIVCNIIPDIRSPGIPYRWVRFPQLSQNDTRRPRK